VFEIDLLKINKFDESLNDINLLIIKEQQEYLKKNLIKNYQSHKRTGELEVGITISKIGELKDDDGKIGSVFIKDNNKDNYIKALALEFGTSKQIATPVFYKTVKDAKPELERIATEIFEKAGR
jgi:hypothetical protein